MNRLYLSSYIENKRKQRERKQAENLEKLDKIVDNSSEKNRNFFIAYLGLLIYVQAIIFSTTDLQLLISSEGLKLPIIDLNVPLVGFYVVIPVFVIALHFNFLQNLESHHYKLMRWQEAQHNGVVPRSSIYPFLFDYAILERKAQLLRWVHWANSLLCYNLAPITLGLLLIRYSDRQDFQVTAWHYLAFVVDVYLVWKLRLAMEDNQQDKPLPTHAPRWRFCTDSFRYGLRGMFGVLILLETLLTGMIGGASDADFVKYVQPWAQPISNMVLASTSIHDAFGDIGSFQSDITSTVQTYSRSIEWLLPRLTINADETVWKPDKNELEATATFAGYKDWVKYFNKLGKGFQTTCKSLRLASLPWQDLSRAQLNNMKFQGANLSNVQMQGADLMGTQLQGARIERLDLQGVILGSTAILHSSTTVDGNVISNRLFTEKDLPIPVLAIFGEEGLFENEKPNWSKLKQLTETIPDGQRRDKYDERIQLVEKFDQSKIIEQSFRYKPAALAQDVLLDMCGEDNNNTERLKSVQAFRKQYISLVDKLPDVEWLDQSPEYQALLKDIDRKICTLEECADLRNNMEGINCKLFTKKLGL